MNHELFPSPEKKPPTTNSSVGNFRFISKGKFIFSLSLANFSFSVEFENPFGKVLIFVADFGSTLFPFIFSFNPLKRDEKDYGKVIQSSRFIVSSGK